MELLASLELLAHRVVLESLELQVQMGQQVRPARKEKQVPSVLRDPMVDQLVLRVHRVHLVQQVQSELLVRKESRE